MRLLQGSLIVAVVLAMPASAVAAQSPASSDATLRPGDAVRVAVWQRPDLSGEFVVSGNGRLAHPILQDAVVTGVPFDEATLRLRALLRQFVGEVRFTVDPLVRVAVSGEVRQPSLYHLSPDMTIAFAVALAGGPTDRGRLSRVVLLRDGVRTEVDVNDPEDPLATATLRSGDQILVTRTRDILREYIAPLASVTGAVAALLRLAR
jgi:protein involved in polysaccharide export with SLBB domain